MEEPSAPIQARPIPDPNHVATFPIPAQGRLVPNPTGQKDLQTTVSPQKRRFNIDDVQEDQILAVAEADEAVFIQDAYRKLDQLDKVLATQSPAEPCTDCEALVDDTETTAEAFANLCRSLLFAPPPQGPEADMDEADIQREQAIRHHKLLYALKRIQPILFCKHAKRTCLPLLEQFHREVVDELCLSHYEGISFPDPNHLIPRPSKQVEEEKATPRPAHPPPAPQPQGEEHKTNHRREAPSAPSPLTLAINEARTSLREPRLSPRKASVEIAPATTKTITSPGADLADLSFKQSMAKAGISEALKRDLKSSAPVERPSPNTREIRPDAAKSPPVVPPREQKLTVEKSHKQVPAPPKKKPSDLSRPSPMSPPKFDEAKASNIPQQKRSLKHSSKSFKKLQSFYV